MLDSDLIFSLGPNCRNTWNIRAYFGIDQAFPFDWWITPAPSMLKMLDREFVFEVSPDDLLITEPTAASPQNTVYNRKLRILHHHDFDRVNGVVQEIASAQLHEVNKKYRYLFARFWQRVEAAARPVAVINGFANLPNIEEYRAYHTAIKPRDLVEVVRDKLGGKTYVVTYVVIIQIGQPARKVDLNGGVVIVLPDRGAREDIPAGQVYAEPIHVFREAYQMLQLRLSASDRQELRTSNNFPTVRLHAPPA